MTVLSVVVVDMKTYTPNIYRKEFPVEDSYKEIKELLGGGMLEYIDLGNSFGAYIDEEGKFKDLNVNGPVTKLFFIQNRTLDSIMGTAVIVGHVDNDGNSTSAPPDTEKLLKSMKRVEIVIQ